MTVPRITVALDVPDPIRSRARWALAQLLATLQLRWREVAPGHGPDIGYGCAGGIVSIDHHPASWRASRQPGPGTDTLATTFWHLARVEESAAAADDDEDAFDEHGRFRPEASHLLRDADPSEIALHAPVDVLAAQLRETLGAERFVPAGGAFSVGLSHDIDVPWRLTRPGVRRLARGVVKGPARAASLAGLAAVPWWLVRRGDPWCNAGRIARLESAAGAASTSYLLLAREDPHDGDAASLRGVLPYARAALAGGGQVGLHGSYGASTDVARIAAEIDSFAGLLHRAGHPTPDDVAIDHRYHYLRHRPEEAWPALDAAGVRSDASLGYASRPGMRAGYSHPYQAWDLAGDRPLGLTVVPLVFMDATLEPRYLDADEAQARSILDALVEWMHDHGSAPSVLWHNDQLAAGTASRRTTRLYRRLLDRTAAAGGTATDVGSIVRAHLEHAAAQRT